MKKLEVFLVTNFNCKKIVLGFLFLLVFILQVKSMSPTLQGKVTSITGMPINKVSITIESIGYLYKTETDENGYFKMESPIGLPSDIYKIHIESYLKKIPYNKDEHISEDCRIYFRPATRANVRLDEKNPITLNFILIDSGEVCFFEENSGKPPHGLFPTLQGVALAKERVMYETLTPLENFDLSLNVLIQYGNRFEKKGKVVYSHFIPDSDSSVFGNPFPGVVITYNNMTVYAEKAELDKNKKIIQAVGNIVVEDGKTQFRAKKVEISIKNGEPRFFYDQ